MPRLHWWLLRRLARLPSVGPGRSRTRLRPARPRVASWFLALPGMSGSCRLPTASPRPRLHRPTLLRSRTLRALRLVRPAQSRPRLRARFAGCQPALALLLSKPPRSSWPTHTGSADRRIGARSVGRQAPGIEADKAGGSRIGRQGGGRRTVFRLEGVVNTTCPLVL